jgi:hypothetical protein
MAMTTMVLTPQSWTLGPVLEPLPQVCVPVATQRYAQWKTRGIVTGIWATRMAVFAVLTMLSPLMSILKAGFAPFINIEPILQGNMAALVPIVNFMSGLKHHPIIAQQLFWQLLSAMAAYTLILVLASLVSHAVAHRLKQKFLSA